MADCICFPTPPSMHTTHYGAIEPASMLEPNPECREHFPKRVQECKDCEGLGEWACYGKAYFCKTCDGTGEIERTGTYRLADGTWSDGVDRTKRILHRQITSHYEITASHHGGGIVWQADRHMYGKSFETWAKAIAYADRMARTNQGENNGR